MPGLGRQQAMQNAVEVLHRLHQSAQLAFLGLRVGDVMIAFRTQPLVGMSGDAKAEAHRKQQEQARHHMSHHIMGQSAVNTDVQTKL
jgi:hypothetical protein